MESMLKGGGGSFEGVLAREPKVPAILMGGGGVAKSVHPLKWGGGGAQII